MSLIQNFLDSCTIEINYLALDHPLPYVDKSGIYDINPINKPNHLRVFHATCFCYSCL